MVGRYVKSRSVRGHWKQSKVSLEKAGELCALLSVWMLLWVTRTSARNLEMAEWPAEG